MKEEEFEFPTIPASESSISRRKLIYGVGVNDAGYIVKPKVEGKQFRCPYYEVWYSMIRRCYSNKWQEKYPTYKHFNVCEEWLAFSNFKTWMEQQNWFDKQINKDCIHPHCKTYSTENCTFVDVQLNKLLNYRIGARGTLKQGVSLNPRGGYVAQCNNGKGKVLYIGTFPTEYLAYEAYVTYKHALILQVASEQEDIRVKDGLLLHADILLKTLDEE